MALVKSITKTLIKYGAITLFDQRFIAGMHVMKRLSRKKVHHVVLQTINPGC